MSSRRVRFTLGLVTVFVLAGCHGGSLASLPPEESFDPATSDVPTETLLPTSSPDYCGSSTISIDYAPYTTMTLAGYGWQFVVADVTGIGRASFNTANGDAPAGFPKTAASAGPDLMVYTPIEVDIAEAITGSASPGRGQFLVEGGTVGCYTMFVSPTPAVEIGARYVFIVSDAADSSGQGSMPLAKARFAWPVDAKGTVTTVDGLMSIDDLRELVASATPSSPTGSAVPDESPPN